MVYSYVKIILVILKCVSSNKIVVIDLHVYRHIFNSNRPLPTYLDADKPSGDDFVAYNTIYSGTHHRLSPPLFFLLSRFFG